MEFQTINLNNTDSFNVAYNQNWQTEISGTELKTIEIKLIYQL